jgi:hypothetical protein
MCLTSDCEARQFISLDCARSTGQRLVGRRRAVTITDTGSVSLRIYPQRNSPLVRCNATGCTLLRPSTRKKGHAAGASRNQQSGPKPLYIKLLCRSTPITALEPSLTSKLRAHAGRKLRRTAAVLSQNNFPCCLFDRHEPPTPARHSDTAQTIRLCSTIGTSQRRLLA